jgi:hypothetical protein
MTNQKSQLQNAKSNIQMQKYRVEDKQYKVENKESKEYQIRNGKPNRPGPDRTSDIEPTRQDLVSIFTW